MLNPANFFRQKVVHGVHASDNTICLPPCAAEMLDSVGKGNHTYLVLRCQSRTEVIKYTHTEDARERKQPTTIFVERDILGGGRKNFPPGSELAFEWFGAAIIEYIKERADGL